MDFQQTVRPSAAPLVFEDIAAGEDLPALVRGPMSTAHLMRWSAAIENWHRIHYDRPFAQEHDGLPGLLINGSWKQHLLVQLVRQWHGPSGWLVRIGFQFRKMNVVDETLTAWGRVLSTSREQGIGIVRCEIGIRNQDGVESTPGTATVALPVRGGSPLPYPFDRHLARD